MGILDTPVVGSACFGLVIGWMACRVHHDAQVIDIKWLAAMIGTIGGAAVTALVGRGTAMFGAYCIGLAVGFFLRPLILKLPGASEAGSARARHPAEPGTPPDRGGS